MRKFIVLLPAAFMALAFFSCKDDARNTEPLTDPWLRERTPGALRVETQVGSAVIVDSWRDDSKGTVTLTIIEPEVDLSAVRINTLQLPGGATADIAPGSAFDFTAGDPQFTVTSENGTTRTYTVYYNNFIETLAGTYHFDPIAPGWIESYQECVIMVIGGPDGGTVTGSTLGDKNWNWGGAQLKNEHDNIVSFKLSYVDEDTGTSHGTVVNHWGADGLYSTYVFQPNSSNVDYNAFYRQIPKGQSKWAKDVNGKITFYDYVSGAEIISGIEMLGAGNPTYSTKQVPIANCALHRAYAGPYTQPASGDHWLTSNLRDVFTRLKKVDDEAHADHETWLGMTF